MNKFKPIIYLLILLNLNLSCAQTETNEGNTIVTKTSNLALSSNTKKDTLAFTSGIRSILQDSKGNYWFGSHQEGVCLFDGKTFTYFTTDDGLSDNQVRTIQEDQNGVIWFGTGNGVSNYKDGIIKDQTPKNTLADSITFVIGNWALTDNDLWFAAGINEGVYRYDGKRLYYLAFPNPKVINPNSIYSITSISKGKNNMLWLGTYAGVFGYNGSDFTIINDETLGLDIETEPLHIRSLLEDSKGRLWIGNNGIGVLLKEGDSIINFSEKNNLIHPTSTRKGDKSKAGTLEHIFTIAEDHHGNIWFGDRDTGIWKFDGKAMENYTKLDKNHEFYLTNDFAQSIYEDRNGELWFGMVDGNIFKFNGKTFEKQF